GWQGVWVPASFVWRAPFTTRRARDEQALFEKNRQRYQDRLCGLRLGGLRRAYEPHCRGDACEDFAPSGVIQLRVHPAPRRATEGADGDSVAAPRISRSLKEMGVVTGDAAPPISLSLKEMDTVAGDVVPRISLLPKEMEVATGDVVPRISLPLKEM